MNKLNKRELILIIVLCNLIGYYLLFNLIGVSISIKNRENAEIYDELKATKEIMEIENIKKDQDLKNFEEIEKSNKEIEDKIFSITNNENIHYFINNLAKQSNITITSINIEKNIEDIENTYNTEGISEEDYLQEENEIQAKQEIQTAIYTVKLDIFASYEEKINFIKNIEKLEKAIAITEIEIKNVEGDSNSSLILNIFGIEKLNIDNEFMIK